MRFTALVGSLGALVLSAAIGCTIVKSKDNEENPDGGVGGEAGQAQGGAGGGAGGVAGTGGVAGKGGAAGTGGAVEEPAIPAAAGGLDPAPDCVALEKMLKDDAKARNNAEMDAKIAMIACAYGIDAGTGGTAGAAGAAGSGGAPSSSGTIDYSKTNAQVDGVDEADIVKTDGEYIYLLHSNIFTILKATPPADMAVVPQGTMNIEGRPTEMFVDAGRVVIYSVVDGHSVYQGAKVTPKPTLYENEYGYGYGNDPPSDITTSYVLTKVTVIELTGTPPTVNPVPKAELYFEGNYLSSRRVDNAVRTVLTGGAHGPTLKHEPADPGETPEAMIAAYKKLKDDNNAKIDAATYKDWLPYRFVKSGATITASEPACSEYMVPKAGSSQYGLTQIYAFDWTAPTTMNGVSIPAKASVVYGGKQSLYVAAVADSNYYEGYACQPTTTPKPGQIIYFQYTYIHDFDFKKSAITPEYLGSAAIPGGVLNQFSVDENAEHFRVATGGDLVRYVDKGYGLESEVDKSNHVFTMEVGDGKELKILGRIDGLGKGENLHSTRFIEDKAFVVTFEQIDPLIVVDLADPAAPAVLGQIDVPGFSEYVHPIGKPTTHLLTIGKETEPGPVIVGLKVSLFDVTTPTAPKLVNSFVFKDSKYGYSEAENNHKAFNYSPDKGILTFPYVAEDYSSNYEVHSFLEVFKVDTTAGITQMGEISHDDFFNSYWWEWCKDDIGAGMRRGMFIGDNLYSVSYGGIKVNALTDLKTPIGSASLSGLLGAQCAMP
ncbi:MAG: beta-propeller domain-containing protein [Deltaproteobacteria bacterium]|nr:beta-propeller domain-containing protein [Deltaproteobacteria bacterium]